MQRSLIVVSTFLGFLCAVRSKPDIFEYDIDKLMEKKMESFMKKYDRKIALLGDKINSQEMKIQILEEKCSGQQIGGAEEQKEEKSKHLYAALNRSAVTSLRNTPELKSSTILDAQKRIVPSIGLYIYFHFEKLYIEDLQLLITFF